MHVDEIRKIQHEAESIEACVSQATQSGKAAVCITWSVILPSGMMATCQVTTTLASLMAAVDLMKGYELRSSQGEP